MSERIYVETVESHGWHLYDITNDLAAGTLREYEELELAGRAITTNVDSHYLLAPTPAEGQTVREANEAVKGVGPSLHIGRSDSPDYSHLVLHYVPNLAMFTRLVIRESGVGLYGPQYPNSTPPDLAILNPATAQQVFARDFTITPLRELYDRVQQYNR